jgi:hypothetical protein
LLRNFGLKVGIVGVVGFEQRIHDLVEGVPELADIMLIPEARRTSGFDITAGISTRHQRFAFARLSGPYLTGSRPAFCCHAHHNRF